MVLWTERQNNNILIIFCKKDPRKIDLNWTKLKENFSEGNVWLSKFIRVGRWERCQYNWYSLIMRYALKKIQIMKIRCKKTFIWYQNLTYDIIILVRSHAKSKSGGVGCVSLGPTWAKVAPIRFNKHEIACRQPWKDKMKDWR